MVKNMAVTTVGRNFVCKCKFERNIFLKGLKWHVTFQNRNQFLEDYSEVLHGKNISEEKLEDLISEIEDEISRRRAIGRKSLQIKQAIADNYKHMHPHLLVLQEDYLCQEFIKLVNLAKDENTTKDMLVKQMKTEQAPLSYSFQVFKESFCDQLLEELDNFYGTGLAWSRPNSMNDFGVLLSELGYQKRLIDPLVFHYLSPITKLLYPEWVGDGIDSHRTFIVTYEIGKDVDLSYHYDDAEVTLNVSLGKNYEGGEIYIAGMNNEPNWSKKCFKYNHRKTYGFLHRGRQMHGAIEVESGARFNLIIWMRSSSIRNKCCPMCNRTPDLIEVEDDGAGFTEPELVNVCSTL